MEWFVLIMTDGLQVLEQHLACAAHEHPLSVQYDEQYFGACLESCLNSLKDRGYLCPDLSDSSRIWNYIGPEVYEILKAIGYCMMTIFSCFSWHLIFFLPEITFTCSQYPCNRNC
jgi:hypothetical protein